MRPRCIAITGQGSVLAEGLARRLLASSPTTRVIAVGTRLSTALRGRIALFPIDLGEPSAAEELADLCRRESVEVLAHVPFEPAPGETFEGERGWLEQAAENVGDAMAGSEVGRLVFASSTMVYGARRENPNFCLEDQPLHPHPHSPWLNDQCRAEQRVLRIGVEHPRREVCVLRHCWVAGPDRLDPILQYLGAAFVPLPLGRDPLLQLIHERDLLDAYERAVLEPHHGVFNVVGEGVLPLSRLLAIGGKRRIALPPSLLRSSPRAPSLGRGDESPDVFFDFLRYLWVADGMRGWGAFGRPHYTTQEAWIAFVASRRSHEVFGL